MNKKILLPLVFILGLAAVSAVAYYAIFSTTINVTPAISVTGDLSYELEAFSGDTVGGSELLITNAADSERTITLSDDSPEDIDVSYLMNLPITQKIVDFNLDVWEIDEEGDTALVELVVVGDTFTAEVVEGNMEGYSLIYYKDNSDRFESPALAILIGDVEGNLPYENDKNADEYNYCETGEYATCHGAKIWYVPTDAITEGELDWSRASEFLFETYLVQYNVDGELTIYGESSITVLPEYAVGDYTNGTYTITTNVA